MAIKYGIVKSSDNQKTIVGMVSSMDVFKKSILDEVNEKYLENVTEDQLIDSFVPGKYLIGGDNKYELIEKLLIVNEGYFYNSSHFEIKKLCSWELVPYIPNPVTTKNVDNVNTKFSSVRTIDITMNNNIDTMPLDLNNMCDGYKNIMMIAKRGSGKSYMIKDILQNMSNINYELYQNCLIISPTERFSIFYKKHFPKATVIYNYDEDKIESFLKDGSSGVIVMDDCLTLAQSKSNSFNNLMMNNKSHKKTIITVIQYPIAFSTYIKQNLDYVFLFREDFSSNKKKIYDHYGNMFNSFTDFNKQFDDITRKPYNTMIIGKYPQRIYEYKAVY